MNLLVHMPELVFNAIQPYLIPDKPIVAGLKAKFKFADYLPAELGRWGYGGTIETVPGSMANWITCRFSLPQWLPDTVWQSPHYQAAANIGITLMALHLDLPIEGDARRNQLLTIESLCLNRGTTCGLGATVSPALADWVARKPDGPLAEVADAMHAAYWHMFAPTKGKRWKTDFIARSYDGKGLNLSVPGSGTCLYREWSSDNQGGYELDSHNVDTPLQQLTLLVGLAKLCDLASAELYPES